MCALDRAIFKVEEELKGMEEADRADKEAEKEARNPRTWFWNLAGMAARKGRVEEEEGRRKTERRHREEGRKVRLKEVNAKWKEKEELMARLWENQEMFRRAQMETIEEFEKAEKAREEWEKKERERMEREWMEAELGRARRREKEEMLRKMERERGSREEEDLLRKMEEENMEETKELFEEFSERVETEEEKEELWQDEFCEEAEEGFNQESEWQREAHHDPRQSRVFENVKCEHDYDWRRAERGHLCSRCGILSSHSMFRCEGCFKVVCEDCQRKLRGEAKWKSFDVQPDIFQGGAFSVF